MSVLAWIVLGVETNLALLQAVLASDMFASGSYTTDFLRTPPPLDDPPVPDAAWIAAALAIAPRRSEEADGPAPPADPWSALPGGRSGA